jgi:hypothetical protein
MKIINNKTFSVFHIPKVGLFVFAILLIVSCIKESIKPDNDETKNKAEYKLFISDKEDDLIGDGVDSSWDPSLGMIWLGTDQNNLPTGTLTIIIDSIVDNIAVISSATLSTVDALVGTAVEINGKTYSLVGKDELQEEFNFDVGIQILDSVVVGANYISGRIGLRDETGLYAGWLMKETSTGENHMLTGTFTAISNN